MTCRHPSVTCDPVATASPAKLTFLDLKSSLTLPCKILIKTLKNKQSRRTSSSVSLARTAAAAESPIHLLVLRWTADLLQPAPTGHTRAFQANPGNNSAY